MDIRDTLRAIQRNWLVVVVASLVGVICGAGASMLVAPTYTADTELFVAIQGSGSITELQQGNVFSQARVQSYVETVTTPVVLKPAIDSLGLTSSPTQLASKIKVSTNPNTVLVKISVSDTSPVQSAAIAQAVADSLVKVVDELEKPRTGGTSPVKLSIVRPAEAPSAPSAPNTKVNIIAGLAIGLLVGAGLAVLRQSLDSRLRSENDLKLVTDSPVLGGITFDQGAVKQPLLTEVQSQSPRSEAFRQIRTNLHFATASVTSKSVLVTSSVPGEGKTTTATNLALTLASTGQSVCLIDADLRRPMVGDYLGLDRHAGLTTAILGRSELDDLLQPWGQDSLYVLTSGQIPPNPSELLGSDTMHQILLQLENDFDVVVIDAPPMLPVTDAAVLSQYVGGVLLVVGTHVIRKQQLIKTLASLNMVSAKVLGVVLNQLPHKGPDAYASGYYSYAAPDRTRAKQGRKAQVKLNLDGDLSGSNDYPGWTQGQKDDTSEITESHEAFERLDHRKPSVFPGQPDREFRAR
ncbi:polysaccharide biosynthesis tyrosine autokinase [Arthrobacter sp. AG367]|uniref:polysaccharide biosynthesis tyrosine autokinase n=1 Tax=Arthrobacter sp. AG367 TaxID=2572909 RepID=UPI0011A387B0|nr:polysaccharide biosynthesis tyrosine autokinase [Arthrobacter sp. AG367]